MLATALPASAATNILTVNSTSGPAVRQNDVLTSGLKGTSTATFTSTVSGNNTTLTCKVSTLSATDNTNPAPGSGNAATLTLPSPNGLTFSSCSVNIAGAKVNSVTVQNLPYSVSVTDPATNNVSISPGGANPIKADVNITLFGFQTFDCVYQVDTSINPNGNILGTTSNTDNSITVSGQPFKRVSGPTANCVQTAKLDAVYATVVDTNQSNGSVFTN